MTCLDFETVQKSRTRKGLWKKDESKTSFTTPPVVNINEKGKEFQSLCFYESIVKNMELKC